MKAVIIGCGRVGSTVARRLHDAGWDVSVVDEDEEAFDNLGPEWSSRFTTRAGHALDTDLLDAVGTGQAAAVVVATEGDYSNIVIGQFAQKHSGVGCGGVGVLDPAP